MTEDILATLPPEAQADFQYLPEAEKQKVLTRLMTQHAPAPPKPPMAVKPLTDVTSQALRVPQNINLGFRSGVAGLAHTGANIARKLHQDPIQVTRNGHQSPAVPDVNPLADVMDSAQRAVAPKPEEQAAAGEGVIDQTARGLGEAPPQIAGYAAATALTKNPALAMGAMDAAGAMDQGTGEALKAGARGAALGQIMKLTGHLPTAGRVAVNAGIGAGTAAVGGGDLSNVVSAGLVGGTLGAMPGHGEELAVYPKFLAEMTKQFGKEVAPHVPKLYEMATRVAQDPATLQALVQTVSGDPSSGQGPLLSAALKLYNWSNTEHPIVDPSAWGTGKPGAEQRRAQNYGKDFQKRYSAWDTPEANESGFGPGTGRPIRHTLEVPEEKIYDLQADPEGLIPANRNDITMAEKAVKEAGYHGYKYDNGAGKNVYAMFHPAEAQKIERVSSYDQPPEQLYTAPPQYAREIASAHAANGGSTFNLHQGDMSGSGKYMVSIFPDASRVLDKAPTPQEIHAYAQEHAEALKDPNVAVGTWLDPESGKHYLDLSAAVDNKDTAVKLGRKYNQVGVGKLGKNGFEFIPTGGSGEMAADGLPPIHARLNAELAQFQPRHSSVRWLERPLDIASTGEKSTPLVEDVGRAFQTLIAGKEGPVNSRGKAAASDRMSRAMKFGIPEARYQIAQGDTSSGVSWYKGTLDRASELHAQQYPELRDPTQATIFKMVLAATSPQQGPVDNTNSAYKAWDEYKRTGEVQSKAADGTQFNVVESALQNLGDLINEMGETKAAEWLTTKHPIAELEARNPAVKNYGLDDEAYGTYIMGPKVGAFAANLNGIASEVTMDTWWTRSWNRWMGTMFAEPSGSMVASPRSGAERRIMRQYAQAAAKMLNLDPMDYQAAAWYYEQALYRAHGISSESVDYEQAAKRANEVRSGRDAAEGRQDEGGGEASHSGGVGPDVGNGPAGIPDGDLPDWVTEGPPSGGPKGKLGHPASRRYD